ncbi:MAG TPA: LLM class flavin-dependent oxidoreductase [Actinomycetota bacterium]|nr:LLM class flavin-dependent oxidoreductase [Actinomycetota bacterium]
MIDRRWSGTGLALAGSTLHRVFGRDARARMPFEDLAEAATLAEQTGYDSLWIPDHGIWDPFGLLAALSQRCHRIRLATGVVTITSRPAKAMSAAASTLADVSGGRAILGVGSGSETRLARVIEYLNELNGSPEEERVPVYLAALGPRMVELAGMVPTDGLLLNWCTPARVRRAKEELARHGPVMLVEGHPTPPPSLAVYVRACLGHDEAHALEALRPMVAMYASIPAYRRQLEADGLGEPAAAAADARARGNDREIPEALVDALCIRGGRDEALARLDEYRAAGADLVVVYPVTAQDPASSLMGTIMAAAPDPSVEA